MLSSIADKLSAKTTTIPHKWVEKYRYLPDPLTKEPAPMSYKYFPWTKEMTDCNDDFWVSQKGAQLSVSEVLINIAFHALDKRGISVLYVLPAQQPDARDFSTTRFNPALEYSPYLQAMFSETNTLGLKMAGQLSLYIRGSRGEAALKSIPVGMVILDEVDAMDDHAIALARERMSGQMCQTFMRAASTPSVPGEGVNKIFENSSKDFFTFKCPSCSRRTRLTFPECLVVTAEQSSDPKVMDSYIICRDCQATLPHPTKHEWLADGKWESEHSGRVIRGFGISQLYSSTVSPGKLAISYLDSHENKADEQEFYNSKLGLPHVVAGSQLSSDVIQSCRAPYFNGELRPGLVTMGIDVGEYLHIVINSYRFEPKIFDVNMNSLCQLMYYGKIPVNGNPDFAYLIGDLFKKYQPTHLCIDAGPERAAAELLVKQLPGRAHTVNYAETVDGKDISEIEDHKISVNRTYWLDISLGRFKNQKITLPSSLDPEFIANMCVPTRHYTKDRNGKTIIRYMGSAKDDYAHAYNYAEIALRMASESGHLADIRTQV